MVANRFSPGGEGTAGRTYEEIHTYRDKQVYGEAYEPVGKVLTFSPPSDPGTA